MSELLNTLRLCYDKVTEIPEKGFVAKMASDKNYSLMDYAGNILNNAIPYNDIKVIAGMIFGDPGYSRYYLLNDITKPTSSEVNCTNVVELSVLEPIGDSGAYLTKSWTGYGILGSNGKMLTPFMYKYIGHRDSGEYGYRMYAIYTDDRGEAVVTNITLNPDGTMIDRLLLINLGSNNSELYQVEVLGFNVPNDIRYLSSVGGWSFGKFDKILEDSEIYQFKCRPAIYGTGIGANTYSGIYYNRVLESLGLFGVFMNSKPNMTLGIVDRAGNELVKPGKYDNIQPMGNGIFACRLKNSKYYEIVCNSNVIDIPHKSKCIGYNPNNPLPIIHLIFENGEAAYLKNDGQLEKDFIKALDISKYYDVKTGQYFDMNRIRLYGRDYIVYNDFSIVPEEVRVNLDLGDSKSWVSIRV